MANGKGPNFLRLDEFCLSSILNCNHSWSKPRINAKFVSDVVSRKYISPVNAGLNVDKINNSKLPAAIKQAMIEHPIEQMPSISLNETLDMDFIKGAKRLMEQEGVATKSTPQPRQQASMGGNVDMNAIAVLIENTLILKNK